MMDTRPHHVELGYTRKELLALFALARAQDVEHGGRYDARGGMLHIWSHPWTHPATRDESTLIGSLAVNWVTETIWRIECHEGFSLDDLLRELGILEQQALGRVKHGTRA
jgi:hypothetical protein